MSPTSRDPLDAILDLEVCQSETQGMMFAAGLLEEAGFERPSVTWEVTDRLIEILWQRAVTAERMHLVQVIPESVPLWWRNDSAVLLAVFLSVRALLRRPASVRPIHRGRLPVYPDRRVAMVAHSFARSSWETFR